MEVMPIVDGLSDEFKDEVSFFQLDATQDANARLQNQWGLRRHPSFAVIDSEASIVRQFFGPQSEAILREAIKAVQDG